MRETPWLRSKKVATIDLDYYNLRKFFPHWFRRGDKEYNRASEVFIKNMMVTRALNHPDVKRVEVYRTRKGFHLYVWFKRELSFEELVSIRRALLDDPDRLNYDLKRVRVGGDKRGVTNNILFTIKMKRGRVYSYESKRRVYYKPEEVWLC